MSRYSEKVKNRKLSTGIAVESVSEPQRQAPGAFRFDSRITSQHIRYTILARVSPECLLRATPMEDKPSPQRDFTKDSFAVTVVCYRLGKVEGEIELLAFVYKGGNGGQVPTFSYRFPTETAEQNLNETSEMVAMTCLKQEVFASSKDASAEIGPIVRADVKQSDSAHRSGPSIPEELSPPTWYEASNLLDNMLQRGIRSHRLSFLSAMQHLAEDRKIAIFYTSKLKEWARMV